MEEKFLKFLGDARVSHWTSLIKEYMGENLEGGINQDLLLTIQTKERLKEKFKI